jgi:hypothetical protein
LRTGVVATQRAISSSTVSMVAADSHSVPGDQACSLDLLTAIGGSSSRPSSSP